VTVRVRVVVSGRVQGVFFRASTAEYARRAGVGGFVRNLADGRVEAAFEGDEEAVEECLAWAGVGPSGAVVDSIEVVSEPPAGEVEFRIR